MSREVHAGRFDPADLSPVPDWPAPVVLASGGPVMNLVCVEGDNALCEWWGAGGRTLQRHLFPAASLMRCERLRATP